MGGGVHAGRRRRRRVGLGRAWFGHVVGAGCCPFGMTGWVAVSTCWRRDAPGPCRLLSPSCPTGGKPRLQHDRRVTAPAPAAPATFGHVIRAGHCAFSMTGWVAMSTRRHRTPAPCPRPSPSCQTGGIPRLRHDGRVTAPAPAAPDPFGHVIGARYRAFSMTGGHRCPRAGVGGPRRVPARLRHAQRAAYPAFGMTGRVTVSTRRRRDAPRYVGARFRHAERAGYRASGMTGVGGGVGDGAGVRYRTLRPGPVMPNAQHPAPSA